MKKSILALSAVVLLFTACKKDDPEPTKREILTTGNWRLNEGTLSYTIPGNPTTSEDFYAKMDACEKDDLAAFLPEGNIRSDEGATKCASSDPQTEISGTWDLNTGDSRLLLKYNAAPEMSNNFVIDELTNSTLRLHFDSTYNLGPVSAVYKVKMAFIKQ